MATVRIKGGSDLKARLAAIPAGAPEMAALWADDTASRMLQTAPHIRRSSSSKFTKKSGRGPRGQVRAAVYGAFWWIFVDRGAKRHEILGSGRKNPPDWLKFSRSGRTVFAKKVNHPGQRRQPFISKAAQDALASSKLADLIIKQWNKRRIGAHTKFL